MIIKIILIMGRIMFNKAIHKVLAMKFDKGVQHRHGNKWIFCWKRCVFTPANENSYVPTALGSHVWTAPESAASCALYLPVSRGH